jgi:uncharacterized protein YqjF (DUF2071 family)
MGNQRPFLTAAWRFLAVLNYEIDPALLRPLVPAGTELDAWHGTNYISLVGFLFEDVRVKGFPVPLHRNFEEVNLRFYVRREAAEGWRRGVVFIREIVPRLAVAKVANWVYGERYLALPMGHRIERAGSGPEERLQVEYSWHSPGFSNRMSLQAGGLPQPVQTGSEEEFITEHYWGYTSRTGKSSGEYRVEHPRWRVWQVIRTELVCDAACLYGPGFAETLAARPRSTFLADGSPVAVYPGDPLA